MFYSIKKPYFYTTVMFRERRPFSDTRLCRASSWAKRATDAPPSRTCLVCTPGASPNAATGHAAAAGFVYGVRFYKFGQLQGMSRYRLRTLPTAQDGLLVATALAWRSLLRVRTWRC